MLLPAALMLSVAACGFDAVDANAPRQPAPPLALAAPKPVTVMPTAMDKLRGMAPPQGIQTSRLFDEKLSDDNARLDRLEHAVQGLRTDVDTLAPTVVGMEEAKLAPPPPPAPVLMPVVPAAGQVTAFRFADHADKTRVVLDLSAPCACAAKLDNKGKQLVVSLPSLDWAGAKTWDADSAKLVSGYHVVNGVLYVDMMYPAQIKAMEVLKPSKDSDHYRFMVDLVSPSVHK